MIKAQQRLKIHKHNVCLEEINKIALGTDDVKRIQLIHSIETYSYGTSKELLYKKDHTKCNNRNN